MNETNALLLPLARDGEMGGEPSLRLRSYALDLGVEYQRTFDNPGLVEFL